MTQNVRRILKRRITAPELVFDLVAKLHRENEVNAPGLSPTSQLRQIQSDAYLPTWTNGTNPL
jgi:hypothetical protein